MYNVLVLGATDAKEAFNTFDIPYAEGTPGKLYWTDGRKLDPAGKEATTQCCENGGTAIVDAVDPDNAAELSSLIGEEIIVYQIKATELVKNGNDQPLLAGISNDDLYWRQKADFHTEAQLRISGGTYTSTDQPMIEYAIEAGGKTELLVRPGGIAVVPYRKGQVILLTIQWDAFLNTQTARVSRLLVSMLHNLGASTSSATPGTLFYVK
jgi:hypothetical protein